MIYIITVDLKPLCRKSLGVKMAFLSRSLIIFSAPDESNRNSSPAYFLLDLPRELRHIHRLAGGRHPINHEKLAPYLLLLASSLKSMSRLLDRWATQGWAYLFLAWPAIIIEKIQIRAKASSYAYLKYYKFSAAASRVNSSKRCFKNREEELGLEGQGPM